MHTSRDLLLDALAAAAAAVATALILDRLQIARRASEASGRRQIDDEPPLPAKLAETAASLAVFRAAMAGSRGLLARVI